MGVLYARVAGAWVPVTGGSSGGGGSSGFTFVQSATPTATAVGNTWYRTDTGRTYIWYSSAWVEF